MALSSPGIGSGLDVNSIVSQLVAIEKQPLKVLQTKATTLQSQLSLYGTIKSQTSALADAAAALARPGDWSVFKATSSNASAVAVTAGSAAAPAAFGLTVSQLARAQATASMNVAKDATLGTASDSGTLTISLGSWASGSFVGAGGSVDVAINGDDTLTAIAGKINAANAGVTATVLRTGSQERLVFQSKTTGEEAGFQIASAGFAGLDSLSFTSLTNPAQSSAGMELGQTALNAKATLNGVAIESASNTLADTIPGLTLKLQQVTTAPVDITVEQDQEAIKAKIQAFADAYTALNKTLADATKYVQGGTSGPLQGDATTVGIQRVLSNILSSSSAGSTFSRLSEVGLERQKDGSLKLDSTKLTAAMQDMGNLQKLFAANNGNAATNGFGLKIRDFARGLIAADGTVTNRSSALQGSISRNSKEQDKVNDRAGRVEKQLRQQYSALDTRLASMQSLGDYVTAQLAQWNKSS